MTPGWERNSFYKDFNLKADTIDLLLKSGSQENYSMKPKSLLETNPYLKDPVMREKLIARSVVSSCGVEGVKVDLKKAREIQISRKTKQS